MMRVMIMSNDAFEAPADFCDAFDDFARAAFDGN
jgi:hypothetical protein